MPYGVYNGNGNAIVKYQQDNLSIHNKNMEQTEVLAVAAESSGEVTLAAMYRRYKEQTTQWAIEANSMDDDNKRVMKLPPARIRDNIPALQHVSERAERVLSIE